MTTVLQMEQGKRALQEFHLNYHTGIDLVHHAPNDVEITDGSLTEFAYGLEMTSTEINHMKAVAERVLTDTVQPLTNVRSIEKIILSECHLCNCGRNDSGFDVVVLMKPEEDLNSTLSAIKQHVQAMTSRSAGRATQQGQGQTAESGEVERHEVKTVHPQGLHFEHDGVHVNLAVGHRYAPSEESNRTAIWDKIDRLDKDGSLKKVHLDQFSIDLYESTCLFMNNQVGSESLGGEAGTEKFIQGALRLARAWRQCCLSSRDVQFSPLDAWLVMLHAVHVEVTKHEPQPREHATTVGGTMSGLRRSLKDMFKGRGVTGKVTAGGREVSMTNVMRQFLQQLANLEEMNIVFADFYDSSKIPDWIKDQRPLILDPVCPYRNTVYNLHKHVNEDIKKHAQECQKILDQPNATLTKLFQLPSYKKRGA